VKCLRNSTARSLIRTAIPNCQRREQELNEVQGDVQALSLSVVHRAIYTRPADFAPDKHLHLHALAYLNVPSLSVVLAGPLENKDNCAPSMYAYDGRLFQSYITSHHLHNNPPMHVQSFDQPECMVCANECTLLSSSLTRAGQRQTSRRWMHLDMTCCVPCLPQSGEIGKDGNRKGRCIVSLSSVFPSSATYQRAASLKSFTVAECYCAYRCRTGGLVRRWKRGTRRRRTSRMGLTGLARATREIAGAYSCKS
jgi:hypothetical protein